MAATVPLFANNAVSNLAVAGSYLPGATALTVTAGHGARFPSPNVANDEFFPITIVNGSNDIEICYCTARTADTLTVMRGQEGTTARELFSGEKVEHRLTAGVLLALRDRTTVPMVPAANSITTAMLQDDAVTLAKMANNSVGTNELVNGAVNATKLAPGAAITNLGFTPVQQGSISQVVLGWDGTYLQAVGGATTIGALLGLKHDGNPAGAGYRGAPLTEINANYVVGAQDMGRLLAHTSGDHTYFLPASGFGQGSMIQMANLAGLLSIAPDSGAALVWVPSGASGARLLTAPGIVTCELMYGGTWWVYGVGLS